MIGGSGPNETESGTAPEGVLKGTPLAANLVGGGGAEDQRRARQGGSYSRFVRWMKFLLPFLALGLVALIVIWPRLKSEDTFRIAFSSVRLSGTAQPGVDNARFMGTDEKLQPYSITADMARIDTDTDGLVKMEMPKADLTLDDGTWLVLTADNGRYFENAQLLELEGGVNLFHDTGYEISTDQLVLNLRTSVAESKTPVAGHGPFGEMNSNGLKLIDKGRVIFFSGPAKLKLYPAQSSGGDTDQNGASQ
ncbi:MAG: LPS export ABC transporter periplasmic protein LptC [Magnetovibrio sp.]|nr:LPS export ABC transporter periplasmic protein LptC [Magnetovibrio sp.]